MFPYGTVDCAGQGSSNSVDLKATLMRILFYFLFLEKKIKKSQPSEFKIVSDTQ